MTALVAYIGRDNEERLELLNDGSLVTAGAVTRAVFKFGPWCLDTEEDPTLLYFEDSDNQVLLMKLGLITEISTGQYVNGRLTLYDAANTNGLAWSVLEVTVQAWLVCEVAP